MNDEDDFTLSVTMGKKPPETNLSAQKVAANTSQNLVNKISDE